MHSAARSAKSKGVTPAETSRAPVGLQKTVRAPRPGTQLPHWALALPPSDQPHIQGVVPTSLQGPVQWPVLPGYLVPHLAARLSG